MPIYEYECLVCGKVSDHLVLNRETFEPYCKHCGAKEVKKIVSRVRVRLSLDTRIERLADPAMLGAIDENDPKSVMKLVERMGAEFGSELGDEFDEIMDLAKEEIEEEMAKGGGAEGPGEAEAPLGEEPLSEGAQEAGLGEETPSSNTETKEEVA